MLSIWVNLSRLMDLCDALGEPKLRRSFITPKYLVNATIMALVISGDFSYFSDYRCLLSAV